MTYRPNSTLAGAGTAGDQFIRRVRSILNKLTPENFCKLTEEFLDCDLGQLHRLKLVVDLVFEKAVDESKYCRLYALLCRRLNEEVPNYEPELSPCTSFQKNLMNKLQYEFQQRRLGNVEPGSREKRQLLGLSTFIGELYSLSIFGEASVHTCLKTLLTGKDPEALECLVRIMETSGEKLDHAQAKNMMDQYFQRIKKLSENMALPSRVRFRLLDVIDMRKREWRLRRQVAGPRPVSEIRAEFGSDLGTDQIMLKAAAHQGSAMSLRNDREKASKVPKCKFFAPRSKSTQPAEPILPSRREPQVNGSSTIKKPNACNGNGAPVRRYEPIRKTVEKSSTIKVETKVAKKAFMPEFIKSHSHQTVNTSTNGRYTSLNRCNPSPQFQARSGLPGQTHNLPFDRINRDRSSHLRKSQSNRNDSPTHSPIRNGSYNTNGYRSQAAMRPLVTVTSRNNSEHRRTPDSAQQSPISPLADETRMDKTTKMNLDDAMRHVDQLINWYMEGDVSALERFNDVKLLRKSLTSIIVHIFHRASNCHHDCIDKWSVVIKSWADRDITSQAVDEWFETEDDLGPHAAHVVTEIVINNYIEPQQLEKIFGSGKFHPLFFIIMKNLFDEQGFIFIQKHFGNIDLLGMMKERDRTELRLLLVQNKLLFLRPKYREEHLIEEEKGLEPKEIYRSIKDRCKKTSEFGNSAGAMINLMWENRINYKKSMPILKKLIYRKIEAQVECLKVVVLAHIERGLPKGALVKQFYDLYHDDIIEEDSFLRWEADINDQTPKRVEALQNVNRFFVWLHSAEEESDEEKETQVSDNLTPVSVEESPNCEPQVVGGPIFVFN